MIKRGIAMTLAILWGIAPQVYAGYVNSADGLCFRTAPSEDSAIIQVLPYGMEIATDGKPINGWLKVEGGGYVCADYIQDRNPLDNLELLGKWRITAYTWTGYPCANGEYPTEGCTIACNALPFGTEVYIEGVGFRTVEDRGPTYLGYEWCDLYMESYNDCVQWGDQYRNVYLVRDGECLY